MGFGAGDLQELIEEGGAAVVVDRGNGGIAAGLADALIEKRVFEQAAGGHQSGAAGCLIQVDGVINRTDVAVADQGNFAGESDGVGDAFGRSGGKLSG